jgi:hypothetical protein
VRNENREFLDYKSGFAALICVYPNLNPQPTKKGKNKKFSGDTIEEVAVLPLEPFLHIFCKPDILADKLKVLGKALKDEWNATNVPLGKSKKGQMVSLERRLTILRHEWINKQGLKDSSEYNLHLNTYGFTRENNHKDDPSKIRQRNIRVRDLSNIG